MTILQNAKQNKKISTLLCSLVMNLLWPLLTWNLSRIVMCQS